MKLPAGTYTNSIPMSFFRTLPAVGLADSDVLVMPFGLAAGWRLVGVGVTPTPHGLPPHGPCAKVTLPHAQRNTSTQTSFVFEFIEIS
jgi:hypothetical protein